MQTNEKVHTLFEESPNNHSASENNERLVAERDAVETPNERPKRKSVFGKLVGVIVVIGLLGGAGYFATRMNIQQDHAVQGLRTNLADLETRVSDLLSSTTTDRSQTEKAIADIRSDSAEIHKTLNALSSKVEDLKATVDTNTSAVHALDAKLEANKVAAKQARKVSAIKLPPKPVDDMANAVKPVFPNFTLVSIDSYAWQNYAVVRSKDRGLVDLGSSDVFDGWRVVEFDVAGQRVAFESEAGVLRWLIAQP